MSKILGSLCIISLTLLSGSAVHPQTSTEPNAMREKARKLLLSFPDNSVKGSETAELTIVEFSDYQCPFCARHFRETLPQIERHYIKTGKVKYVFRNFPIEPIHPLAFKAAEAANCAGEQGKYWEMHDRLFANQKALSPPDLSRHAKVVGLDMSRFQPCLDSGSEAAKIRADIQDGIALGVKSTPTFLLAHTGRNHPEGGGIRGLRGAVPYETFKKAIDDLLARPPKP